MLVNTLYAPHEVGGAERSVRELAESLASAGATVSVVCLAPRQDSATHELLDGVEVHRIPAPEFAPFGDERMSSLAKASWHVGEARRRTLGLRLGALVRTLRPDVVHTNNIAGFGVEAWWAAGEVPLVHTMRDYYLMCPRTTMYRRGSGCEGVCGSCSMLRVLHRRPRRRPDLFVGVSHDIVARHRRFGYLGATDQTVVVPNRPRLLSAPRDTVRPNFFGYLGRISADKGAWVALESFRQLKRSDVTMAVAGDVSNDRDRQILQSYLDADPRVHYVGRVDAAEFLHSVAWLLAPAQWPEPFGRVAAEAASAGCGVLASHIGGLPETVDHYGGRTVHRYSEVRAWQSEMARCLATGALDRASAGSRTDEVRPAVEYSRIYRRLLGRVDPT
jgi:glycosyltransferase involved in cell wall biosynthesis